MDQSGHYPLQPQRPLFQTPQLPPPSQLHLPSFSRNNTLPPISQIPNSSARYPPTSYQHPSLSAGPHPSSSLPNTSQLPWSPAHRTSSSRDEISPALRHSDSRSSLRDRDCRETPPQPQQDPTPVKHEGEDGMPSTSDFVKKLYKMLEDPSFNHVVSWGPHGDCFVVKDMNEFTKTILPKMFKHSNFASFVRQLNKYDFHKVKNTDENQFGEHSWTFRHPDFHADRRDALENIKRKVPAARKSTNRAANSPTPGASNSSVEALQNQLERMVRTQDEMAVHIRNLENNYQNVLTEMVNFQRNMAQQDGLMQNLIQYFLQLENGKVKAEELSAGAAQQAGLIPDPNPFLPAVEAQRMMGNAYPDASELARASLAQMNEISRRAEVAGMTFSNNGTASTSSAPTRPSSSASRIMAAAAGLVPMSSEDPNFRPMSRQDALARMEELQRARPASAQGQLVHPQSTGEPAGAPNNAPPAGYDADPYNNPMLAAPPMDAGSGGPSTTSTPPSTSSTLQYGVPINNNSLSHEGLQVFTVGHLMPKSSIRDDNGNWSFDPNALNAVVMPTPQGMGGDPPQEGETESQPAVTDPTLSSELLGAAAAAAASGVPGPEIPRPSSSSQTLRVRRSTYVPGWAVPPRVLLVDDDAVSRKLSSKFLQVFGCTTDVAVDGFAAVNKMNLEKYDLVLMDIVMPKLDGVSATSLIRQFDHMTPIISMTSNSKPTEILKYYSSGMNDILPKPFTKDGLLDMLEKHLMHLKVIQTMSKIPRSLGIPPLSDAAFDQALVAQANGMVASSSNPAAAQAMFALSLPEDDGKINPLAGMGLSDEQYTMILQNIVNGESFMGIGSSLDLNVVDGNKRPLDDAADGRDGKRGRFEVIE